MSVLDVRRRWTINDLGDLPEDGFRYEIVDGHLVVTSGPTQAHDELANDLRDLVAATAPTGWRVRTNFLLPFAEDTVRFPDVLAYRWPLRRPRNDPRNPVSPSDVGLAVEIVSPSSRRTDRFHKPAEYADAGIPIFWRVETDPDLALHAFRLERDRYVPVVTITAAGEVPVPWGTVDVRLADLGF